MSDGIDTACRACGAPTRPAHGVTIRGAAVQLYRCPACGLFEFPDPTWLAAAYADPISEIDVGLPSRCVHLAATIEAVVRAQRLGGAKHLDYGGGYGLLTRLARDRGIDMWHHDPYARNLFAQGFDAEPTGSFGCVAVVEVLEHLTDPLDVMRALSRLTGIVIVSTVLVPEGATDLREWWYLIPDLGQHITFYTPRALGAMGRAIGFDVTSDGVALHVFHRRPLSRLTRLVLHQARIAPAVARTLHHRDKARSFGEVDAPAAFASLAARRGREDGAAPHP